MSAVALRLSPLPWGWAVVVGGGRELARFIGPGAKRRAERYATDVSGAENARAISLPSWIRRRATRAR